MDFDRMGGRRGRFRGFRGPQIDTDQVADAMPDVDLERFARQVRDIDLDRFAKQLREIDLDRFGKQLREIDFDKLGRQVKESAGDVRDRIQGRQEPDRALPTVGLLAGVGIGAAAMYLLDPEQGPRRRALLRQQLLKARQMTGEAMESRSREASGQARGGGEARASSPRRTTQGSREQETAGAGQGGAAS
jgi:gas vesicle protein